jgi:hypothetical protein
MPRLGLFAPINQDVNNKRLTMKTSAEKTKMPTVQEMCIDLPGETVQCWRSSDKIKVILRKHRDVIFDLKLIKGKTYTVQATESDFYNKRDNVLVYAKRRGVVTFSDGERLHLWVARGFKGALLLKSDGKTLMKIDPNEMDRHQYDDDPKTKCAPIIISLGQSSTTPAVSAPKLASKPLSSIVPTPLPSAAPIDSDCAVVCVVDGNIKGMPEEFVEYFKKGGGNSGLANLDYNKIATRNWIWGQVAGTSAYVKDNWGWLRASLDGKTHEGFKMVKAKIGYVKGKVRFYFSGYSKYNTVFGGGGFGPGNDRIMNIFAGVGKSASSFGAVAKGIAGSFKSNALVSFIFGTATAIAEWKNDVKNDGYDLAAALFMTILKAIIVATLTVAFIAVLVMWLMLAAGVTLAVIAIGILTVGAGVLCSYGVEFADKKLYKMVTGDVKNNDDGLSKVLAPWLKEVGKSIDGSWQHLMAKFPNDYKALTF